MISAGTIWGRGLAMLLTYLGEGAPCRALQSRATQFFAGSTLAPHSIDRGKQ